MLKKKVRIVFHDLSEEICQDNNSSIYSFHLKKNKNVNKPCLGEPLMESVGMLSELLPELIILLLPLSLLAQLNVTFRDNLLQVTPGLFKSFHVEPGVGIRTDIK